MSETKPNGMRGAEVRTGELKGVISELLTAVQVTSEEMSYSNQAFLSPLGRIPKGKDERLFVRIKGYVLIAVFNDSIPRGKIGLNKKAREFLSLSLIDEVLVVLYERRPLDRPAASLTLKLELLQPPKERIEIDDLELLKQFRGEFGGHYLGVEQVFVTRLGKTAVVLTVDRVLGAEDGLPFLGTDTAIEIYASGEQQVRLRSTKLQKKNVFTANFSMESLGIGGLEEQLTSLFRRAFASRRLPHAVIEKFGIKHVKGILLFGPPGTGKTLIARQLAQALKAKSLTIVNGPEVFSKYVGESEENIRKLFAPAREDEKKYGEESPLHVIVFDEIDAVCRQRGSDGGGTGTKDAVVNQLLTNLDGVEALNNIIVIGMTNRKDLIDEAVLRPGRLEVHIEIGIPSEQGRTEILSIHTRRLKEEGLLEKGVDLRAVAQAAKNYTGAELEAVVKNAASYAMSKGNDLMDFSRQLTIQAGTKVSQEDLLRSLQEVTPGFGLDQENFDVYTRTPLINYGPAYDKNRAMLERLSSLALTGSKQLTSVLLYGPKGSGKTSLASHFARDSKFSYVKIIAPERFIGVGTLGRINSITKVFNDAYKARESLIVLDNVERLIEYVQAGPDFNNALMQALLVLVKRIPTNPDCRLLVLATSSNYSALELLDIDKAFAVKLKVPLLNAQEAAKVVGKELGIEKAAIKKLMHFKDICRGKPESLWPSLWAKYSS